MMLSSEYKMSMTSFPICRPTGTTPQQVPYNQCRELREEGCCRVIITVSFLLGCIARSHIECSDMSHACTVKSDFIDKMSYVSSRIEIKRLLSMDIPITFLCGISSIGKR